MRCASCEMHGCYDGKDCFGTAELHRGLYEDERLARIHRAATAIEGRHYCKEPRLNEIILFAGEMGFRKLGLVFCIGLVSEAKVLDEILSQHFEVCSVCCKVDGIAKNTFGLERIRSEREDEVMCNPAGAAELLNRAGADLNIICGLCVGHDAIFCMKSKAPVTTLIAKDRVLAHNPAGAIYCQYVRKSFFTGEAGLTEGSE
ncbi:MAG: DUF1847 domain-containing protein [Candidatus Krumholzibacteria bacterium]|nr:DUF1847 domain-containing protein [Candidatus Krumholzibacteria bacterium]